MFHWLIAVFQLGVLGTVKFYVGIPSPIWFLGNSSLATAARTPFVVKDRAELVPDSRVLVLLFWAAAVVCSVWAHLTSCWFNCKIINGPPEFSHQI